jgi:hypothetical protein
VEGRGAATIHDVALSAMPPLPVVTTSSKLEGLLSKKIQTQDALTRCKKSLAFLEGYLGTLNVQHIDIAELARVISSYDATGKDLDDKVRELEKELNGIDEEIKVERSELAGPGRIDRLGQRATIGVFANTGGEVEIVLVYGTSDTKRTRNMVLKSENSCEASKLDPKL